MTKQTAFFATAIAVFAGGCLEYETTTTVQPDGSFVRSVIIDGDSSSIHRWNFRIPVDSTWTVVKRKKERDDKWSLIVEKGFSSGDEWNRYQSALKRRTLVSSVEVKRSFKFFTTTYQFEEVIRSFNPFTKVPLGEFLSPSELDAFLRHEVLKEPYPTRGDSLALEDAEDRFELWEAETRFASYFDALVEGLPQGSKLRSDSARKAAIRASLKDSFVGSASDEKGLFRNPDDRHLTEWVRSAGSPELLEALKRQREVFEELGRDVEFVYSFFSDSFKSALQLPGEVVSSNSTKTEEGKISWDDYIAYAYVSDFTMRAESRVVNVWAIVLAVAILVAAPMLLLVAKGVRKRRLSVTSKRLE